MAERENARRSRKPGPIGWIWWLILAVAVGSGIAWAVWWGVGDRLPGREGATPVAEVIAEPDRFVGEFVTVVATVNERFSVATFTVTGEDGQGEMLVIKPEGRPVVVGARRVIGPGAELRISGRVVRTDVQGLEQAAGVRLRADRYVRFEGQPVLVAQRISFLD